MQVCNGNAVDALARRMKDERQVFVAKLAELMQHLPSVRERVFNIPLWNREYKDSLEKKKLRNFLKDQ